jgi:hypothetical protein
MMLVRSLRLALVLQSLDHGKDAETCEQNPEGHVAT